MYARSRPSLESAGLCPIMERSAHARFGHSTRPAMLDEIASHGFVLTPGRYVGAEDVEDDGEPFEEKMGRLMAKLEEQFAESARHGEDHPIEHQGVGAMASSGWECQLGDVIELKRSYDLPERDRRPGRVPIVSSSGIVVADITMASDGHGTGMS